jgi:hypothetical protein
MHTSGASDRCLPNTVGKPVSVRLMCVLGRDRGRNHLIIEHAVDGRISMQINALFSIN